MYLFNFTGMSLDFYKLYSLFISIKDRKVYNRLKDISLAMIFNISECLYKPQFYINKVNIYFLVLLK